MHNLLLQPVDARARRTVGNFDAHEAMAIAQRLEARAREGDLERCGEIFSALEIEIIRILAALAATGESLKCAS
jgi:hypothetical protein